MPIRAGIGSPRTHLSTRYLSNHPIRRTVPIGGPLGTSTGYGGGHDRDQSRKTKLRIRSLILLSSGGCFALRDLCEPRHHRCGVAVQDLRVRFLADLRFCQRLGSPLAAELGSIGPAHDTVGAVQPHRGLDRARAERVAIQYTFARRKRDDGSSSRAPPDRSPAELTGTTVGFSSSRKGIDISRGTEIWLRP